MSRDAKTKIMVIAAGSAGHVFPAIAFCQDIRERRGDSIEMMFITTPGFEMVPPEFNPVFLRVNKSLPGLLKMVFYTFVYTAKFRPDVVFGFGGYLSVTFLMLARSLGKKTILHEQNVVPGKANIFLSVFVNRIVVSFPETMAYLAKYKKKVLLARYPMRKELEAVPRQEALSFFGLTPGIFTILVFGGSQGASRLNEIFLKAVLSNKNVQRIQVIHLAGKADAASVTQAYSRASVRCKVFDFLSEMNYAYSAADLVIGRSGAGSVMEIMRFGLPSILVPYPYARAHQAQNAKVLADKGGAIMVEEPKFTPELLSGLLDIFVDDQIRRKAMSSITSSIYQMSENLTLSEAVCL